IWESKVIGDKLSASLPGETRAAMQRRRDLLGEALQPAHLGGLEALIAETLICFPVSRRQSKEEAQIVVRRYALALAEQPLWAVREACRLVSEGRIPGLNPDFEPTVPRLAQIARSIALPRKTELQRLTRLLKATAHHQPSTEEKARVGQGLVDLRRRLAGGSKK